MSRWKEFVGESCCIHLAVSAYDQEKRRLSTTNDKAESREQWLYSRKWKEIYFFSKTRQESLKANHSHIQ
jgi:hypothetical protein